MAEVGDTTVVGRGRLSLEALDERIHTQGTQIRDLGGQIRDLSSETRSALNSISNENRLAFDKLNAKFETTIAGETSRRSSFWPALMAIAIPTVFAACGGAFTILTLRMAPMEDRLATITSLLTTAGTDIKGVERELTAYEPRSELDKDGRVVTARMDRIEEIVRGNAKDRREESATKTELAAMGGTAASRSAFNKERLDRLESMVVSLQTNVVPRTEHERHNLEVQREIDANKEVQLRESNELKARFEQLYPASEFLRDLNARLRADEAKLVELQTRQK